MGDCPESAVDQSQTLEAGLRAEPAAGASAKRVEEAGRPGDLVGGEEAAAHAEVGDAAVVLEETPTIISRSVSGGLAGDSHWWESIRGRRLAHFELEEPLGVGGMAAVIRARDTRLERPVALKILPPAMAADAESVRRFHQEARAAARLDHENIARVYYSGEDQGLHFIVFEYVEGENLRSMLGRRGRLPLHEAVDYTLQIAAGLAHACARGVVHRDIKPSNIIVNDAGRAKLVDMGLARRQLPHDEGELTHSGVTLGSFDYMSPEQALEPRRADVRSDIYSLGCTLYCLLTGQPPAPEGTAARKLQFHQRELPLDPRQLNPGIPDAAAAILARMLAKDVRDRYADPGLLVAHLQALRDTLAAGPGTSRRSETNGLELLLPRPPRVRPPAFMAGAALALAVVVLLAGPHLEFDPAGESTAVPRVGLRDHRPATRTTQLSAPWPVSPPGAVVAEASPTVREVNSLKEFTAALDEFSPGTTLLLNAAQPYQIVQESRPAEELGAETALWQPNLTIQGGGGGRPRPIIRFRCRGEDERGGTWMAATGGSITFKDIRFELEAATSACLFAARGGARLIFENCEFVLLEPAAAPDAVALVRAVRGPAATAHPNRVRFVGCVFVGGKRLLAAEDAIHLSFEHCLMGPFQQALLLGSEKTTADDFVGMDHCSWLLGPGPLLVINGGRSCQFHAAHSIFSKLEPPEATLVLLKAEQESSFRYVGVDNYYHDVDRLIARAGIDGVSETLAGPAGAVEASVLKQFEDRSAWRQRSPWADPAPLKTVAAGRVLDAFRIKTDLAELRLKEPHLVLGPLRVLNRDLYDALEPPKVEGPGGLREVVVDGVGGKRGVYENLSAALSATKGEEAVIVLKINGPVPVQAAEFRTRKVAIRAAAGFVPELTFDDQRVPSREEPAMFRLHDGDLTLEGVAIRLTPFKPEGPEDFARVQSLITITGTGRCRLKSCVATLVGDSTALLTVSDPSGAMLGGGVKPPRAGAPNIEMEDCFVRGQGDLLAIRGSRPFRLDVRNCLLALRGSLVAADGNKMDPGLWLDSAQINLDHVTALVGQALVAQRAAPGSANHVPFRFELTHCILLALDSRPFFFIEGPQSDQEFRRRFLWKAKSVAYGTSGPILTWQSLETPPAVHQFESDRWPEMWGGQAEEQPIFLKSVRFTRPNPGEADLTASLPQHFVIAAAEPADANLSGLGADLSKLPAPGGKPAAAPPE